MQSPTLRWRLAQFLERRWWRRYLADQPPADYLERKRAYWHRTLDRLDWTVVPGRRSLDAGCGPAGVFTILAGREDITALDPLLEAYERDLAIFDRADYPGVTFCPCPLEAGALAQEPPFAAVYCLNAINHVSDWGRALDTLTHLAAPGARLLLTSDVHRHGWLRPVFRALPGDALHPQQHTAADYRRALTARGWAIEWEETLRRTLIFDYVGWVCHRPES